MPHNGHRTGRRDQIQAAAEQLFREKGYLATSMRDLADEMNMKGGGSLYAHIKGKEELLWEIALEAVRTFFAALEPVLAQDVPPAEKLRAAIIAHVLVITSHLGATAVYFDEWRHLSDARRAEFQEHRDRYEGLFQQLIHGGVASGVLQVRDERLATMFVLGSLNDIRRWYKPEGRLSAQRLAESMADLALNGLHQS